MAIKDEEELVTTQLISLNYIQSQGFFKHNKLNEWQAETN